MKINPAIWNKIKWQFVKKRLGYNNEQMEAFRHNPRNETVLAGVPILMNKTIVAEVVDADGALRVRQADGRLRTVLTGDVTLRR